MTNSAGISKSTTSTASPLQNGSIEDGATLSLGSTLVDLSIPELAQLISSRASTLDHATQTHLHRILSGLHLSSEAGIGVMSAISARLNAKRVLFSLARENSLEGEFPNLTSEKRLEYFRSQEFQAWVSIERTLGNRVFWLTDLDKAKAAGDAFTFFFAWRIAQQNFTPSQATPLKQLLANHLEALLPLVGDGAQTVNPEEWIDALDPNQAAAYVLTLWLNKEHGASGISLYDFWSQGYWPSLSGITREAKMLMAREFSFEYRTRVFPGAKDEHEALRAAGVDVAIVTFGDEDLAREIAPLLGINKSHVVGARQNYDSQMLSTSSYHSFDAHPGSGPFVPQFGKYMLFHQWCTEQIEPENLQSIVVAGFDGDSPGPDGGAILSLIKLAGFMVNTPGDHDKNRLDHFQTSMSGTLVRDRRNLLVLNYSEPEANPLPSYPPLEP